MYIDFIIYFIWFFIGNINFSIMSEIIVKLNGESYCSIYKTNGLRFGVLLIEDAIKLIECTHEELPGKHTLDDESFRFLRRRCLN